MEEPLGADGGWNTDTQKNKDYCKGLRGVVSRRDKHRQSDLKQGVFWPRVAAQEAVKGPETAWLKIPLLSPQSQLVVQVAAGPEDCEKGGFNSMKSP